jgi:hypothetical protein
LNSNYATHSDSDDEPDDGDDDDNPHHEFNLSNDLYQSLGRVKYEKWIEGIKSDPLRRAQRLVRILRASDDRRRGLQQYIVDGNECKWFHRTETRAGKHVKVQVQVPALQLLRNVKTRWDSVFMMLQRLRHLRLVSLSW